jgi:D-tyrosyl-tRNA(Tyr) deacylase
MRAVVQRVDSAKVVVDDRVTGEIGRGLLVFISVAVDDDERDIQWMANKISGLRIFPDAEDRMNLSALDLGLEVLSVSQFTLHGRVKKGFRPSFTDAAPPEKGQDYWFKLNDEMRKYGLRVLEGIFGARMMVHLVNNGPVTILIDSKKEF